MKNDVKLKRCKTVIFYDAKLRRFALVHWLGDTNGQYTIIGLFSDVLYILTVKNRELSLLTEPSPFLLRF